ncbi:MAG: epimerase [Bacteroidota bacterium]
MKLRVVIFGATGMVGEGVLSEALQHPAVEAVLVVGRRPCGVQHGKLKEILHNNFYDFSPISDELKGYNACFFCLGVSSVGMKEEEYHHISYDLTMAAASVLSRENSAMTFCYVSGAGTDSTEQGRIMWARVKGKTENHLGTLPFKAVYLFRPGFIKPMKGLRHAYKISIVLGMLYPVWKILLPKYVCTLEDVGLAMIQAATIGYSRKILENKDITLLAHSS